MRDRQFHIVLNNDMSEIERLNSELEAYGASCGLSARSVFELNLILEEIVVNVISYAYADDRRHEIVIEAAPAEDSLVIQVEDDGRSFNPLQVHPPDFCRTLEQMPVGGRGLHLVRILADSIVYERAGNKNRLVIRKNIDSASQ